MHQLTTVLLVRTGKLPHMHHEYTLIARAHRVHGDANGGKFECCFPDGANFRKRCNALIYLTFMFDKILFSIVILFIRHLFEINWHTSSQ